MFLVIVAFTVLYVVADNGKNHYTPTPTSRRKKKKEEEVKDVHTHTLGHCKVFTGVVVSRKVIVSLLSC